MKRKLIRTSRFEEDLCREEKVLYASRWWVPSERQADWRSPTAGRLDTSCSRARGLQAGVVREVEGGSADVLGLAFSGPSTPAPSSSPLLLAQAVLMPGSLSSPPVPIGCVSLCANLWAWNQLPSLFIHLFINFHAPHFPPPTSQKRRLSLAQALLSAVSRCGNAAPRGTGEVMAGWG